jgi:hypothetical protein
MSKEIVQTQQKSIADEIYQAAQAASKSLLEGASNFMMGQFAAKEFGPSHSQPDKLNSDPASYGDMASAKAHQIARELDNGDKQGAIDALQKELSLMSPPEFKRLLDLTGRAEQRNKGADLEIVGMDWPNGKEAKTNEKRQTKDGGSLGDLGFSVGFHSTKTGDKPSSH